MLLLCWLPAFPGDYPQLTLNSKGWDYILILGGCGFLELPDGMHIVKRGQMFIINPATRRSWTGKKKKALYRIDWIWRFPPLIPSITPDAEHYLQFQIPEHLIQRLNYLHAICRRGLRRIDQFVNFSLLNLRLEIELLIARNQSNPDLSARPVRQLNLAVRWLEEHITSPEPITNLFHYLAISPAALNRLFHQHLNMSAAAYRQKFKLEKARIWLNKGTASVKEISYRLGYKHPNDFSRAYKRHMGVAPTRHMKN